MTALCPERLFVVFVAEIDVGAEVSELSKCVILVFILFVQLALEMFEVYAGLYLS